MKKENYDNSAMYISNLISPGKSRRGPWGSTWRSWLSDRSSSGRLGQGQSCWRGAGHKDVDESEWRYIGRSRMLQSWGHLKGFVKVRGMLGLSDFKALSGVCHRWHAVIDTDDVCTEYNLQVLHPTFYRPAEEKAEVTSEVITISESKTLNNVVNHTAILQWTNFVWGSPIFPF